MVHDSFNSKLIASSLDSILISLQNRLPKEYETTVALLNSKSELINVRGSNSLHFTSFEPIVRGIRTYFSPKTNEVFITNDPYSGSPRQCDLTLVQGAFGTQQANEIRYYVAVQISIPGLINREWKNLFSNVEEEGYRIPPSPLDQGSLINPAIISYVCQSGFSADKLTQILGTVKSALRKAAGELTFLEASKGREKFSEALNDLQKYSEAQMKKALREIPDGEYEAFDYLDGDGFSKKPVKIQCKMSVRGENILLNFSGSSKQTQGCYNCSYALTSAACFSAFRNFVKKDILINSGALHTFSIEAQEGTLVNAVYPNALLGGYFETTHRIADVVKQCLQKALPQAIPSLGGGSSTTALMKFSQVSADALFFETIGSASGASQTQAGESAIKYEFDNEPAPSIEEIETLYPIQIVQHDFRDSTHGDGKNAGGRALTRGYKFLKPAQLMLLGDRFTSKIQGFFGGSSGIQSETLILRKEAAKKSESDSYKILLQMNEGDSLFLSSPSGAGWGKAEKIPEPEEDSEASDNFV
jgi:N-methylhydantoinase B